MRQLRLDTCTDYNLAKGFLLFFFLSILSGNFLYYNHGISKIMCVMFRAGVNCICQGVRVLLDRLLCGRTLK